MQSSYNVLFLVLGASVLLSACAPEPKEQQVAQVNSVTPPDIMLYQGEDSHPWQIGFKSHQHEQLLDGDSAELADQLVSINKMAKDQQQDALVLNFKDSWSSGLYLTNNTVDLSQYVAQGTVEFDLRVDDIDQGKVDLLVNCEWNCPQVYNLREWAQSNQGKGWQHIAIPLNCLVDGQTDLTQVTKPFSLSTGGKGQLALANVQIKAQGQANMPCFSARQLATTPATLNEYWAVDWWLPRHQQKVAQAALGQAQLVMIGDSITHGWENDGKPVWDKYFSDINTLNLGYGGDRTENVLWRLQHGEVAGIKPKLVVLMIGTNNTGHRMDSPEAIAAGVDNIIDELKQQVPEAKVLLLAIFPRDATPDSLARINNQQATELIKNLAGKRDVLFANFNAGFLTEDGILSTEIMPDLLHPKEQGYEIWAQQLEPYVNQHIRQQKL